MGAIIVRHRRWFSVVNKIQSLDHDAGPRANGDIAAGTGPGPGPGESDSEATALGGEGWIAPTKLRKLGSALWLLADAIS